MRPGAVIKCSNKLYSNFCLSLGKLREEVQTEDKNLKKKQYESGPKASFGYGGSFGVENDKKDSSAVDFNYKAPLSQHASQVDGAKGFGGKFGVQNDRKDKTALGWDHKENLEKHESQKGCLINIVKYS